MAEASILFTNNTPVAANTQHTFTFNALLELDSLQPIAGATLVFSFGDGTKASGTTGSNGIASVTHQCAPCAMAAGALSGNRARCAATHNPAHWVWLLCIVCLVTPVQRTFPPAHSRTLKPKVPLFEPLCMEVQTQHALLGERD